MLAGISYIFCRHLIDFVPLEIIDFLPFFKYQFIVVDTTWHFEIVEYASLFLLYTVNVLRNVP